MLGISKAFNSDKIIIALIIAWSALQFFVLGKYSLMLIGDEMDSIVAAMAAMKHTGSENTFWFPFFNSGTDRLSMSYVPGLIGIIFEVLPTWVAYQFLHISMIALGVVAVYLLSQKIFQMSRLAGYFAALGYGHALFFPIYIIFMLPSYPLSY